MIISLKVVRSSWAYTGVEWKIVREDFVAVALTKSSLTKGKMKVAREVAQIVGWLQWQPWELDEQWTWLIFKTGHQKGRTRGKCS